MVAISDAPYKSIKEEIKLKYVVLFNDYLKKVQIEKIDTELLCNLNKDQLVKLYDYLNKTFEFLSDLKDIKDGFSFYFHLEKLWMLCYKGENIFKVNSTFLLKLHQKIMEKYGNTVLVNFMSSKKCLSVKVKYATKQK